MIIIFVKIIVYIFFFYVIYYSYEQDGRCLLDIIDYYSHTNRELAVILGRTSQRLRQLEGENESQQILQS